MHWNIKHCAGRSTSCSLSGTVQHFITQNIFQHTSTSFCILRPTTVLLYLSKNITLAFSGYMLLMTILVRKCSMKPGCCLQITAYCTCTHWTLLFVINHYPAPGPWPQPKVSSFINVSHPELLRHHRAGRGPFFCLHWYTHVPAFLSAQPAWEAGAFGSGEAQWHVEKNWGFP